MVDIEDRTARRHPAVLTLAKAAIVVCDKALDAAFRALESSDGALWSSASVLCFVQAATMAEGMARRLLHLADDLQTLDDGEEE